MNIEDGEKRMTNVWIFEGGHVSAEIWGGQAAKDVQCLPQNVKLIVTRNNEVIPDRFLLLSKIRLFFGLSFWRVGLCRVQIKRFFSDQVLELLEVLVGNTISFLAQGPNFKCSYEKLLLEFLNLWIIINILKINLGVVWSHIVSKFCRCNRGYGCLAFEYGVHKVSAILKMSEWIRSQFRFDLHRSLFVRVMGEVVNVRFLYNL